MMNKVKIKLAPKNALSIYCTHSAIRSLPTGLEHNLTSTHHRIENLQNSVDHLKRKPSCGSKKIIAKSSHHHLSAQRLLPT